MGLMIFALSQFFCEKKRSTYAWNKQMGKHLSLIKMFTTTLWEPACLAAVNLICVLSEKSMFKCDRILEQNFCNFLTTWSLTNTTLQCWIGLQAVQKLGLEEACFRIRSQPLHLQHQVLMPQSSIRVLQKTHRKMEIKFKLLSCQKSLKSKDSCLHNSHLLWHFWRPPHIEEKQIKEQCYCKNQRIRAQWVKLPAVMLAFQHHIWTLGCVLAYPLPIQLPVNSLGKSNKG